MVPIGYNSIYRLNEDILRIVFAYVADIDAPRFRRSKIPLNSMYNLGWVHLGHVCSHWRAILLSMRELWARDACVIPSALDTFLARAGNRPLSFELPYVLNWDFPPYINMVEAAFDRIERMAAFRCLAPLSWDRYVELDDVTLPLMRSLDISCQTSVFIPKNIHIYAPVLQIAIIRGIYVTLDAPNLRELRLSSPPEPGRHLLDMLSRMPLLETVHLSFTSRPTLRGIHPRRSPWDGYSGGVIHLPRLREMHLTADEDSDVATFLSFISAPINLQLHISASFTAGHPLDALMRALSPYLRCPTYDAMRLQEDSAKSVCNFKLFTASNFPPKSAPSGLSLALSASEKIWRRFLSALPNYTHRDRIKYIDFDRVGFIGRESNITFLQQIFKPFVFVRSVHLRIRVHDFRWDDGFLPGFLATPPSTGEKESIFPILNELSVTISGISPWARTPFAKTWHQIIGMLQRRFPEYGPLQRLVVAEIWGKDARNDGQLREIGEAGKGAAGLLVKELVDDWTVEPRIREPRY